MNRVWTVTCEYLHRMNRVWIVTCDYYQNGRCLGTYSLCMLTLRWEEVSIRDLSVGIIMPVNTVSLLIMITPWCKVPLVNVESVWEGNILKDIWKTDGLGTIRLVRKGPASSRKYQNGVRVQWVELLIGSIPCTVRSYWWCINANSFWITYNDTDIIKYCHYL